MSTDLHADLNAAPAATAERWYATPLPHDMIVSFAREFLQGESTLAWVARNATEPEALRELAKHTPFYVERAIRRGATVKQILDFSNGHRSIVVYVLGADDGHGGETWIGFSGAANSQRSTP
ncbi:hypothetical protein AB3X96_15960 [Paraburkholderia sp. BR13439]|uniref:hypothetical protein n=1 Tax=Paraburkholderia sp. BR13439 TaxID=3236996 RepID=UPI0034CE6E94